MDLDNVLSELGEFSKYQLSVYFLLLFPLVLTSLSGLNYAFTTGDLNYRCKIRECETDETSYEQPWLPSALPYIDGKLESHCKRFVSKGKRYHSNCTKDIFIQKQVECSTFVFENKDKSIIREFGLLCEENDWKRTLIGTLHNIGEFIGMPLAGLFSDRFGRRTMISLAVFSTSIIGILKSFSWDYATFVTCEVAEALAISGAYAGVFILGVEITGPSKRSLGGVILSSYYSIGEIILGTIVWFVDDWRTYLRIISIYGFIILLCCWIMPESVRWLILHRKKKKVLKIFKKLSSMNKKPMSDEVKKAIEVITSPESKEKDSTNISNSGKSPGGLRELFKSKIMIFRALNCSFCWITNAFVFYGLSLCSTVIGGNRYFNFILVSSIEIPGYITTWLAVDAFGRKRTLTAALVISSLACFSFHFLSEDMEVPRLLTFLAGKCAITVSFTTLYVLASEFFPTNLRHSLMGLCSTLGRFGSMIAPQMPLMAAYVDPVLVFGTVSFVAGSLALFFPETLNCKLPDTIEEAEVVGKSKK